MPEQTANTESSLSADVTGLSDERLQEIEWAMRATTFVPQWAADLFAEVKRLRALQSPSPAPTPEAGKKAVAWLELECTRAEQDTPPQYRDSAYHVGLAWSRQVRTLIAHLSTPQPQPEAGVHPDTARLDTAQRLLRGCDFAWGDPDAPRSVVVLDIPEGVRVGADFRAFLDAATPEGRTNA